MTYWQIASGDGTVDLQDVFLKLNVALIGPGHLGDFFDHRDEYLDLNDGHLVQRFCEDLKTGDTLILRHVSNPKQKEWEIQAAGTVVGPYRYEPIFEDVDVSEWEMQHCRRVAWTTPEQPIRVTGGGAPVRIQKLDEGNPFISVAEELLS
jgi:hypothetical protein